jgi:hypothetical protein
MERRVEIAAMAATIGIAISTAALTLLPVERLPIPPDGSDKLHHAIAWAALVFPMSAARPARIPAIAFAGLAFGVLVEILQPYSGRSSEFADIIADVVGIAIGCVVGRIFNSAILRRYNPDPASLQPGLAPQWHPCIFRAPRQMPALMSSLRWR